MYSLWLFTCDLWLATHSLQDYLGNLVLPPLPSLGITPLEVLEPLGTPVGALLSP
jgi:hypothetical protein